ncbi:hypothetical protein EVAR_88937_1 [Eumeta japonica]|uniref:PiggyBac transposable element-derived protein 4 C-terminal zinc-finger domain-containing protein n=1 Tax=Eumeta variegata TaxID=151549 RepID=A0A4C1VP22_EUMVA|nr:hypothetical protein EVAR_88937_1 [Eumeta japonica]
MRLYDYRLSVIDNLPKKTSDDLQMPRRANPTHTITRITEKNSNGRIKRKHCRQCYKQKKRSDTTWHCVACNDKPGLCVECFDLYHEQLIISLWPKISSLRPEQISEIHEDEEDLDETDDEFYLEGDADTLWESEHESNLELSDTEESTTSIYFELSFDSSTYFCKDKSTEWNKFVSRQRVRQRSHNIVTHLPGSKGAARDAKIGFSENIKGCKVYDPVKRIIITSRDLIVMEKESIMIEVASEGKDQESVNDVMPQESPNLQDSVGDDTDSTLTEVSEESEDDFLSNYIRSSRLDHLFLADSIVPSSILKTSVEAHSIVHSFTPKRINDMSCRILERGDACHRYPTLGRHRAKQRYSCREQVWVDWKNKTKKAASIRTEISCTGGGASRKLILSEQEQRLLYIIGKSAVMGRGPEIGFQNVTLAVPVEEIAVDNAITSSEAEIICTESEIISRDPEIISTPLNVEISAEQVIVPVEQEALNQSQLSRTPAPAIPAASRILSTRPNTEDEEDAEPPRTAGRTSTHRVDRRRRRRPTPFQMASVQFAEIEQRRLDLEERRLEVDRLREENIAQNRQLQEKFLQDVVGTVLIERSSGGQHLAAFQAFEDSTDSRH